jgi:hypothetical protein
MDDVGQAINITSYYLMEGEVRRDAREPVSNRTPVFRDIAISNMTIRRARVAMNIEGLLEMPISGLRISNVVGSGKAGMKAQQTAGMELHDVQINAESGPAFSGSRFARAATGQHRDPHATRGRSSGTAGSQPGLSRRRSQAIRRTSC